MEDIEDGHHELADKIANGEIATNQDFADIAELTDKKAKQLQAMGGEEAIIGRIMAAINDDQNALAEKLNASLIEQGMDFATLYTARDYDKRIAMVAEYETYNQDALAYAKDGNAMKKAQEVLDKEKVSSSVKADFLKKLKRTY